MSSDLPAQGLFQQLHAKPVSGEHLEVLGKSASSLYRSGSANTLTEAVVETVKQAGLSPEQVQRVIEFANTDAFLYDFKKEGAGHRVVALQGGPADPSEVFKDLNDGGGGTVFDRGTADYDQPPGEKKASDPRAEQALVEAFRTSGQEYEYVNPLAEAYDTKTKLAAAEEHLTSELSLLEGMFNDITGRLYEQVKQAALSGNISLGEIVQCWAEAQAATPECVKVAFSLIAPRLVRERVFVNGSSIGDSLQKTASARAIVNVEHPLVLEFGEFCQVLTKMAEVRAARTEISEGLGQISLFLKHASHDGLIKKVYDKSKGLGQAARPLAEGAAGLMLGKGSPHVGRVGKVVEKGIEHIPTAAALVGANEMRRHLKYSPVYQGAKNTALQVVPGTPQYQQREYELASGGMGPMGYGY